MINTSNLPVILVHESPPAIDLLMLHKQLCKKLLCTLMPVDACNVNPHTIIGHVTRNIKITDDTIKNYPQTRFILRIGSGTDTITISDSEIRLFTTKSSLAPYIASYALYLLY